MYEYAAFGTAITSEFRLRLPDQGTDPERWRLSVRRGEPPARTLSVNYEDIRYGGGPDWLQVDVPWVARYHVAHDAMIVAPVAGADEESVGRYLVGFVLPLLMRRRPVVLLHASAVADEHGAIVVTGDQGAGKSTTAAALVARGFSPLCDDVVPIAQGPMVLPGIAQPKLLPDAYQRLVGDPRDAEHLFDGVDKFQVPMGPSIGRSPLRAVFVLGRWAGADPRLTPLTGVAKLKALIARLATVDVLDDSADQISRLVSWAGKTAVTQIERPADVDSLDSVAEIICAAHWRSCSDKAT